MPGVSTHVNFARLILTRIERQYDVSSFVWGTIAPDCFDRKSDESFYNYHFARETSASNLEYFMKVTHISRQSHNISIQSFIDGYYSHLWFDNFTRIHENLLRVTNPSELPQDELNLAMKSNIEQYDLADTATFLEKMGKSPPLRKSIPGLEFVSFECVTRFVSQLTDSSKKVQEISSFPVILARDDYNCFLENAVDEFVNVLQGLS